MLALVPRALRGVFYDDADIIMRTGHPMGPPVIVRSVCERRLRADEYHQGQPLGDSMLAARADLTVTSLPGGHWLLVECKTERVEAISVELKAKG